MTAQEPSNEQPLKDAAAQSSTPMEPSGQRISMAVSKDLPATPVHFIEFADDGTTYSGTPGSKAHATIIPNLTEGGSPSLSIHATDEKGRSLRAEFDIRAIIDVFANVVRVFESTQQLRLCLDPEAYVLLVRRDEQSGIRELMRGTGGSPEIRAIEMIRLGLRALRGQVRNFDFDVMGPSDVAFLQGSPSENSTPLQVIERLGDGRFRLATPAAVLDLYSSLPGMDLIADRLRKQPVPPELLRLNDEIECAIQREITSDAELRRRLEMLAAEMATKRGP